MIKSSVESEVSLMLDEFGRRARRGKKFRWVLAQAYFHSV